ncbi:hypothetical protein X777_03603 [Ooceraea biroi]|uniref:Uncharacterized protein n=1 Tax=Ooceraea biroi TaxID=2015173 RepID=A0A026WIV6_OOCBI|nr:hypothetical protein X777_03603 [Ooceraea biroi]
MPGVHVRTLSQFDWLDQEKESILTIPGSYWLCHKKNIYKFIFRYHRTVKNTMQFSYGRELLKIIRRIIKCHPSQGQQFGTQHLLVTYNCTSWTRQDKMFAILKFQQRTNAAAFSHAFVLTIRICPSSEESLFNRRYPIVKEADAGATFQDLSVSLDTEEKNTKSMTYTTDKVSSRRTMPSSQMKKLDEISDCNIIDVTSETTVHPSSQDSVVTNSINVHELPDARMEKNATATVEVDLVDNTEFHDNTGEAKSVSSDIERNAEHHPLDAMQERSFRASNRISEIESKDAEDVDEEIKSAVIKPPDQETLNTRKYKIFSSMQPPVTGIIKHNVDKWSSSRFSFLKDPIKRGNACASNNKDDGNGKDDKKVSSDGIAGSLDVPYQYFIEKEIESADDALSSDQPVQTSSQATAKNADKDGIPKVIKESDERANVQALSSEDNQGQNSTYNKSKVRKQRSKECERKTVPEDKILRSSNITDLVMEGLMFTIKQDKDSVAVIEQKTKLEVDEVLENSEKVETKAGEKCLVNSSLLRLENLVTMIDSPRGKQDKTGHASGNSAHLLPLHTLPSRTVHNLSDTNYASRRLVKPDVFGYNRHDGMDDNRTGLVPYRSRWQQHHDIHDINDNTNLLASGDLIKKSDGLMEWQDSKTNEQDRKDKDQMEVKEKERKCEEEEEEEEDIMPENLSSIIFSEKANAGLQDTDLLMDDIEDIKQTGKHESPVNKCSDPIEMRTAEIPDDESKFLNLQDVSTKRRLNTPRVISDKLITVEQMPPALQKILQHKYRTRRLFPGASRFFSKALQRDEKVQHSITENVVSKASVSSLEDERGNSEIANKSIDDAVDPEETKGGKNESSVTVDKDEFDLKVNKHVSETNDRHTRYARRSSSSETHRVSRRNSTLKHGSPRKLQDITEDFFCDLMQHTHSKSNSIQQRCLRQRRKSLDNPDDMRKGKVRIEMLKFIQDITEGVRVVVKRLDMNNKSHLLQKNSALATYTHM